MPQSITKTTSGLRIRLIKAPVSIQIIEYLGLPSARTKVLPPVPKIKNGNPRQLIPAKISAYFKTISVAPKAIIKGFKNTSTNTASTTPLPTSSVMALPIYLAASSRLPAPSFKLKLDAPPTPKSSPNAVHTVVNGKATLVAALPYIPTLRPIKN